MHYKSTDLDLFFINAVNIGSDKRILTGCRVLVFRSASCPVCPECLTAAYFERCYRWLVYFLERSVVGVDLGQDWGVWIAYCIAYFGNCCECWKSSRWRRVGRSPKRVKDGEIQFRSRPGRDLLADESERNLHKCAMTKSYSPSFELATRYSQAFSTWKVQVNVNF